MAKSMPTTPLLLVLLEALLQPFHTMANSMPTTPYVAHSDEVSIRIPFHTMAKSMPTTPSTHLLKTGTMSRFHTMAKSMPTTPIWSGKHSVYFCSTPWQNRSNYTFVNWILFCLLRSNITSIMLRPIKQHNIMPEQAREKIIINGHCGPIDSL